MFADVRDKGRTMRISYHEDPGTVVVSLWQNSLCRGSVRLAAADLGRFISVLTEMTTPLKSDATPAGPAAASPRRMPIPAWLSRLLKVASSPTAQPAQSQPSAIPAHPEDGPEDRLRTA